jgi:shikimate dehydrogenase
MISGSTRLLALVGDPVDKARSPEGFTRLFELNGHDAIMIPVHVTSPRPRRSRTKCSRPAAWSVR